MAFAGFAAGAFEFLRDLAANQNKAWFDANRDVYERELKRPLAALVDGVAADFAANGITLTGDAKQSLFRINRDVRFSADKSPYKTNAGAVWFRPGGGKDGAGLLYFHVAEAACFMAAAFYRPDKDVLGAIREGIRVRPEAFLTMVESLAGAGLSLDQADSLRRMPAGFEDLAGGPLAPYLRMRNLMVSRPLTRHDVAGPKLVQSIAGFAQNAMPLLQFGWRAVDEVTGRL